MTKNDVRGTTVRATEKGSALGLSPDPDRLPARPTHPTWRRTLHSALLELTLTALMMFAVTTTVRWLMGTLDPAAGGWWNTPEGRLVAVAPLSGYTVTAVMLSPWAAVAAIEAGTMFVIVIVIVAVAGIGISSRRLGRFTPWAVGTMIATQILAFGTLTGGVANPAREFGPAVFVGDLSLLPVYLLAPPMGALAATAVIRRVGRTGRIESAEAHSFEGGNPQGSQGCSASSSEIPRACSGMTVPVSAEGEADGPDSTGLRACRPITPS